MKQKSKDAIANSNWGSTSIKKATKSVSIHEWTMRDHIIQGVG